MRKDLDMIRSLDMTDEEWLEERRHSIGGSDAAAILGLSKWSSPYTVWADKTGRLEPRKDTEAMRTGRDLERYVASRWCEATKHRVRRCNFLLRNPDYPWAHANVDRLVLGEDAGLECKTTASLNLKQFRETLFPEQYYPQCVHYMAVTGAQRWYLAVLVYGRGFFHYQLDRDEDEISSLMAAEKEFWERVAQNVPPDVDGSDSTSDTLSSMYPHSVQDCRQLIGLDGDLQERDRLKKQMKMLEKSVQRIDNTIKDQMGDCDRAVSGDWRVMWKEQTRRSFDWKQLKEDHPDIELGPYFRSTTSRVFSVRKA